MFFVTIALFLLFDRGETACMVDKASACLENAVDSIKASGCNWLLIMPPLLQCVDGATFDCEFPIRELWSNLLSQFNSTLNSGNCWTGCPEPQTSLTNMEKCFTVNDVANGQVYPLHELIDNVVLTSASRGSPSCILLDSAVQCLVTATAGCSAVTDIAYQRMQLLNSTEATTLCSVNEFKSATTSAPLKIFNPVTDPSPTETPVSISGVVLIGDGSKNKLADGWIVLISLAGAMILVIVVAITYLITRTKRNKKIWRELLITDDPSADEDKLPNKTGWRLISSQRVTSRSSDTGWPVPNSTRPTMINYPVYRRDFTSQ